MTRLLVSVRSAEEARIALEGGAEVVDVKEPRRGALGAAEPAVWKEVWSVVQGRVPTSVALGELFGDPVSECAGEAKGFTFAKVGLSLREAHWQAHGLTKWRGAVRALPDSVVLAPVIYADAAAAGWESLERAFEVAAELAETTESPHLVIDTFQKDGRTLLDHAAVSTLQQLLSDAKAQRIKIVLAGSLDACAIERLLPLAPAYIGVRGAACRGGRDGAIDLGCVKTLATLVHSSRQKLAS